jgi:hypothetical protein
MSLAPTSWSTSNLLPTLGHHNDARPGVPVSYERTPVVYGRTWMADAKKVRGKCRVSALIARIPPADGQFMPGRASREL